MNAATGSSERAIEAARMLDDIQSKLQYECDSCRGSFDERTVEAVLKRAAANTHGGAITPGLESAFHLARMREHAHALLVYECGSCRGSFDERTVEAVLKRAAANTHGEAITPQLEAALTA